MLKTEVCHYSYLEILYNVDCRIKHSTYRYILTPSTSHFIHVDMLYDTYGMHVHMHTNYVQNVYIVHLYNFRPIFLIPSEPMQQTDESTQIYTSNNIIHPYLYTPICTVTRHIFHTHNCTLKLYNTHFTHKYIVCVKCVLHSDTTIHCYYTHISHATINCDYTHILYTLVL